ncbi:hypothetical protein JXO52_06680 [bacterium]|nr:hypothetical protein [bacterium]
MQTINVMFSSRPKLLSEVFHNLIERQPDMRVVGEVVDPIELIFALRKTPTDVIIITPMKANGVPRVCSQLLKEHPRLKILTLTLEGEAVYIYQSGLKRSCIQKPTEQMLLDVIRKGVQ